MSARRDGRGHWPAGKRRSDVEPLERRRAVVRLRAAIEKGESRRAIARAIGMSDRTVRRWLAGEDWPMAQSARRLARLPKPAK